MSLQNQNPQYNPLISTIVNNRNWASGMAALGRGFYKPLALIDALNPNGVYFTIESPDGSARFAYQARQEPVATVASVTQSGANLVLTFTDPYYSGFREKFIMRDNVGNTGYISSVAPGTATIMPSTYPSALVSTSHFLVGSTVSALAQAAGNQNSMGVSNVYRTNSYRTNWSAIRRNSHTVSSRDKFVSYKFDETYYSWVTGEMDMLNDFAKGKMYDIIYSEPGQAQGIEGTYNRFEGVKAAIRNQGGRYIPMATAFTQAEFESDLDWIASNDPAQFQNYMFYGGRAAWGRICSFYQTNITFTQSTRVVNGNNVNFDIMETTIKGITIKYMVGGIFDDKVLFPTISTVTGGYQESMTYFLLNLNPLPDVNGGPAIPVIRKFGFDHSPVTGGAETLYRYIPGMVGPGLGSSTGGGMMNGYQMTASPVMGASFQIAEDHGFDIQGDACVCRFLIA